MISEEGGETPEGSAGGGWQQIPRGERWELPFIFLILLGLRVLYACCMTFNSDEAQHLHVVWGWATGHLQYQEVFDNHTPLFHILCAPVFRLFPETAMIIIYMRLAMIPIFACGIWFVARIGERLFSRRVGLWSAVFTGFAPLFFLKTVEFRTDDLWTVLWLGALMVAVEGKFTPKRMFVMGIILGAAFSVSMKTVLMLLGLMLAGGTAFWFWRRRCGDLKVREVALGVGAALAGILIVPSVIIGYFASQDALGPMYQCVIRHNIVPDPGHAAHFNLKKQLWFPATLPLLILAAREIFRRISDPAIAARRTLVLLAGSFYLTILSSYWPMLTGQDYPPVVPLGVLCLTPGVLFLGELATSRWTRWHRLALPVVLVVVEIGVIFRLIHPRPRISDYLERLEMILHCTEPQDYVMDPKAGAIYRQRPFYYAIENVTLRRLKLHLIEDRIIPDLIRTRTCMASWERLDFSDFDGRDIAFVFANYIPFSGKMRVAGQRLMPEADSGKCEFEIRIKAEYVVLTPEGEAQGRMDGKPYSGKVLLDIGRHAFITAHPQRLHILCWAQAFERGFRPNFAPEPPENDDRRKSR